MPPNFIADVNFDIPGILTVNAVPGINPEGPVEIFDAIFTPVPEPAPISLLFLGLVFVAVRRFRARHVAC